MTPKRFYLILFAAVVILVFAAGIAANFSFITMLNRTLGGVMLSSVFGAVFASRAGAALAKFDPVLARYGIVDNEERQTDGPAILPGFMAVVTACYLVFTAVVPPHGMNITPDYLRKAHVADRKLVALSGADVHSYKEIMAEYGLFLDPARLEGIPQTAMSKIRNPDSIREAAVGISREYGSSLAKDKTEAFRLAVKRLRDMGKEDQLCRLYYGIRERARDRGAAPNLGAPAFIEIVANVNDPRFLESVMLDQTAAMEVRGVAAKKLGRKIPVVQKR